MRLTLRYMWKPLYRLWAARPKNQGAELPWGWMGQLRGIKLFFNRLTSLYSVNKTFPFKGTETFFSSFAGQITASKSVLCILRHCESSFATRPEEHPSTTIMEIQFFFCQRHALSRSFDIFVITYRVKNFLPKLIDMLLFSTEKKNEFPFFVFPYFSVLPPSTGKEMPWAVLFRKSNFWHGNNSSTSQRPTIQSSLLSA